MTSILTKPAKLVSKIRLICFITGEASNKRLHTKGCGGNEIIVQIMQLGHYDDMQLQTMHNAEMSTHVSLLLVSSNIVIIVFDLEPLNSVIRTHYVSVCFDLYSL